MTLLSVILNIMFRMTVIQLNCIDILHIRVTIVFFLSLSEPCHVNLNSKTLFWVNLKLLTVDDGIKQTFRHGIKIEMSCANGYEMEDLSTGRNVNKSRKNIVCDFGEWSQTYACKAGTFLAILQKDVKVHFSFFRFRFLSATFNI